MLALSMKRETANRDEAKDGRLGRRLGARKEEKKEKKKKRISAER